MARIKKGVKQSRLNLKAAREKKKKQTPSVDARVTTSSESPPPPPPSMSPSPSSVKRKNLLTKESDIPVVTQENVFLKKQSLEELASNVCCPECFEKMKCIFTRKHADSSFKIVCTKCSYIAKDTAEDHKSKEKGIYEITIMIVYATLSIQLPRRCEMTSCLLFTTAPLQMRTPSITFAPNLKNPGASTKKLCQRATLHPAIPL